MVVHRVAQVAARQVLGPARLLLVPQQGVAADLLPAGQGPVDDLVTAAVGESATVGFGGVPLHLVLGGDRVELTVEDPGVDGVTEFAGGNGGAEVASLLRGRGAERRRGGGGRGRHDGRAGAGERGYQQGHGGPEQRPSPAR
jgi:hypothetical protein